MMFQCSKDFPLAQIKQGTLRGFVLDGVYTFQGIKYADAQRWQMPQPPQKWDGIKAADGYGFACPIMYDDAPGGELRYHHCYWPSDEKCQYLNVWSGDMSAKKTVIVWIHGGGYSFGSALELGAVNGDSLCRNGDVVVVTLNHRLNILGFFDLSRMAKNINTLQTLAWHCSEIPYVYHSTREVPICGEPVVRENLEAQMCTAWTNFAKYGDPNCAMLPKWDRYEKGSEVTMIFGRTCRTAADFDRDLLEMHFKATAGKR